eukprot:CAMPEP_0185281790 /NCGR_PEP_ID=MMETSP1359-20130426/66913_1 /TAXON_ID=552665 /ORGANISM="Bigelowiella longifila, Strain CCMP242" /LENGTH=32 /DNA_ID= /DNA_START= /DNA_END= /DNA_ORIENTATION=
MKGMDPKFLRNLRRAKKKMRQLAMEKKAESKE